MPIATVIFLFEVNVFKWKNITNVVIFLFEVNGFKKIFQMVKSLKIDLKYISSSLKFEKVIDIGL
jgi:hypothetical protein